MLLSNEQRDKFVDFLFMEDTVIIAESNIDTVTNQGVGAILVKKGKVVGSGCRHIFKNICGKQHKCIHAEQMALMEAGLVKSAGSTLYVTKEPCSKRWQNSISFHYPCCCALILKYGIKRVVIGSYDEGFGGGGKEWLEKMGIKVDLCLDFKERIDKISNRKVDPIVQREYEEFKRLMNEENTR